MVALLTRRVPDLKLHSGVIQTDGLCQEGSCEGQMYISGMIMYLYPNMENDKAFTSLSELH